MPSESVCQCVCQLCYGALNGGGGGGGQNMFYGGTQQVLR